MGSTCRQLLLQGQLYAHGCVLSALSTAPFHSLLKRASSTYIEQQHTRASDHQLRSSPVLRRLDERVVKNMDDLVPPLASRVPSATSKRTGLIGVKVGMVSEWDEYGVLTPLTVIWFDDNQVTQVKVPPFDCTTALQIGCGSKKQKQLRKPQWVNYMVEFKVTPDALLPLGTVLNVAHFVPGQHVDITATTKGKGFAGGMKRWGFKGGPATHGVSLSHRTIGSVGAQGYARVLPGKRMPGRMGGQVRVGRNSWVYRVDHQRNLMWVAGSVHGPQGCFVVVKDAVRKHTQEYRDLPFPTYLGELGEPRQAVPKKNKYEEYE